MLAHYLNGNSTLVYNLKFYVWSSLRMSCYYVPVVFVYPCLIIKNSEKRYNMVSSFWFIKKNILCHNRQNWVTKKMIFEKYQKEIRKLVESFNC